MPPLETRTDSPGRLQKYPKIHVSTGEESSGSGTDSTQDLRPRHGGEILLDFLGLRKVLSTYDGDLGTRSGGLRKGQSPCDLLGGLSGFLSLPCRGLRSCVEWVPETEDSSPVLTRFLG